MRAGAAVRLLPPCPLSPRPPPARHLVAPPVQPAFCLAWSPPGARLAAVAGTPHAPRCRTPPTAPSHAPFALGHAQLGPGRSLGRLDAAFVAAAHRRWRHRRGRFATGLAPDGRGSHRIGRLARAGARRRRHRGPRLGESFWGSGLRQGLHLTHHSRCARPDSSPFLSLQGVPRERMGGKAQKNGVLVAGPGRLRGTSARAEGGWGPPPTSPTPPRARPGSPRKDFVQ